MNIMLDEMN